MHPWRQFHPRNRKCRFGQRQYTISYHKNAWSRHGRRKKKIENQKIEEKKTEIKEEVIVTADPKVSKNKKKMDYKKILENKEVRAFLKKGNENLGVLGYTDHSVKHCAIVAKRAGSILKDFGYSEHDIQLAQIAGAMHDIGNAINREHHGEYGALLANQLLEKMGMSLEDRVIVVSAIGHHDESTGCAVDPISAALILADKTDVRRNRVRTREKANFDIHDRVNYAVTSAEVRLNPKKHVIILDLQIDENICTMYEYFEIFLGRMMLCRQAAELLGAKFKLLANGSKVL